MRTLTRTLIFIFLLAPVASFGQTAVSNLDFENWANGLLGHPVPDGYPLSDSSIENTVDPVSGSSALRVETRFSAALGDTFGISVSSDIDPLTGAVTIGEPYTKRPDSAKGHIRAQIPDADTGVVLFQLTKYDAPTDSTHIVGSASTIIPDTIPAWTEISLPFTYDTCATPDSISIIFSSEGSSLFEIGDHTIGGVLEADGWDLITPSPAIDTVLTQPAVCQTGGSDGYIEIQASNVDSCTMYSIDGGANFQTDSIFTAVDSGVYDVIVETANGSDTRTVVVDSVFEHGVDSVDITQATCGSPDGEFTIHAGGGDTPYMFSNDSGASFQTDSTFSNLTGGSYDIAVEDDNGCVIYDQVFVGTTGGPSIDNLSISHEACSQGDGSITITASGGTAPYTYSIDNGNNFQGNATFNGLSAGNYDVVVQDALGCTDDTVAVVSNLPGPVIDSVDIVDATCGMSDGEIQIHASSGTTPLEYSNDGGTSYQTSDQFTGLAADDYDIMVQDANGCTDMMTVTVDTALVPEVTSASADKDTVDLNNSGDVNFSSTGTGSTFTWDFDDGSTTTGQNVNYTYDTVGTYEVTVYAEAGNCVDSATVVVEVINSTSIEGLSSEMEELSITPNPTDGRFLVELDQVRSGSIEVRDLTGRIVHAEALEGSSALRMDLSDREDGIYLVRVTDAEEGTVKVGRIVLSR